MQATLSTFILVGLGGALGGMARVWLTGRVTARWGSGFPWGTLAVNVSGAWLLGLMTGSMNLAPMPLEVQPGPWLILTVGVLGSYTTVSSFILQSLMQLRGARPWLGCANMSGSILGCLLAAAGGLWLGEIVARSGA